MRAPYLIHGGGVEDRNPTCSLALHSFRVDLKEETEGAVIEFCFNEFHILMAEGKKEYLKGLYVRVGLVI